MDISMRSILAAGVTAVAASAIVMAPSVAPLPTPHVEVSRSVQLVAAVQTPAQPAVTSAVAATDPVTVPLDTPSDVVDAAYRALIYWSGLGVQAVAWGLSIIPFGSLLADQVYAFYAPTIYFTTSLVINLIEPVLDDPTNPDVWANGIVQAAYTGLNSLLNVGINEVNLVIRYGTNLIPNIPIFYVGNLAAPSAAAAAASFGPSERLAHADTAAALTTATVAKVHPTRPLNGSVAPTKSQLSAPSGTTDKTDKPDSQPGTAAVGAAKAAPGAAKAAGKAGKPGRAAHSGKAAK
jgi:hypothetical protein